jgi:hypothetical protein
VIIWYHGFKYFWDNAGERDRDAHMFIYGFLMPATEMLSGF